MPRFAFGGIGVSRGSHSDNLAVHRKDSGDAVGRIPGLVVDRLARTAFVVLLLVEFGVDGAVLAAEVRLRNSFKSLVDCPRQIIVIKNNVPNSNDLLAEVLLKCAAARGKCNRDLKASLRNKKVSWRVDQ